MTRRQSARFPVLREACQLVAVGLSLITATAAAPFSLLTKAVTADPQDALAGASGVAQWTEVMTSAVSGLPAAKWANGKVGGALTAGQAASFGFAWPSPGADLDFGFRDFVDFELLLSNGFNGVVALDFAAEGHQAGQPLDRILLPARALKADGQAHRYRADVGLVPRWRGLLTRLALVIEPAAGQGSGTVAVGRLQVGDRPGDTVAVNLKLNLKPGMKIENLKKVESKHGCTWWEPAHEKSGFDPAIMPRRALRMLEESWQIAVNQLGYRDPCLGENSASTTRHKINHITWYDGFWMGGGDPPHLNIQAGGLHDEGWGNPMPHEFVHTVQAGQLDFLNGCHWESHANYVRFCRNFHFREFTGLDCLDFSVLLRSNYFQDHPRLIYADYRPYFYLDNDPDQFGFAPGLTAKLWQTGTKDERLWTRLPKLLPQGVTLAQVAAGMARSWLTFDFPAGEHIRSTLFGPDQEGRIRWFRYMAPLTPVADRPDWWAVPLAKAPMKFGWSCHEIEATAPVVSAKLEGLDIQGNDEDWRWGFVSLGNQGAVAVSEIFKPGTGGFKVPAGSERLILFVSATPTNPTLSYPRPTPDTAVDRHPEHRRYLYEMTFRGAKPKDLRLPVDMPEGKPHPNGGGFVATTAKVDASAFVGPEARVLGSASVLGQARILDRAVVRETASVRDRAEVSGAAVVGGNAQVSDDARVRNFAFVGGQAKLRERARVGDLAEVQENLDIAGEAWVRGVAAPLGNAKIGGHAILDADYAMAFSLNDGVHFHHVPWGEWYFTEFAAKLTKPRGLVASYPFNETDGGQALDEFGALVATVRGKPARKDGALQLTGKGQYLVLDSSLVDAPAATWLLEARLLDDKMQPLLAINDVATGGVLLGVSNQGLLTAALAGGGKSPVVLASKTRVPTGVPVKLGLRLDGKTAALILNGEVAAERAWEVPPQAYFRDATQAVPTAVFLGRDAKGNGCRADLLGFRAFNVALTAAELAATP